MAEEITKGLVRRDWIGWDIPKTRMNWLTGQLYIRKTAIQREKIRMHICGSVFRRQAKK